MMLGDGAMPTQPKTFVMGHIVLVPHDAIIFAFTGRRLMKSMK